MNSNRNFSFIQIGGPGGYGWGHKVPELTLKVHNVFISIQTPPNFV